MLAGLRSRCRMPRRCGVVHRLGRLGHQRRGGPRVVAVVLRAGRRGCRPATSFMREVALAVVLAHLVDRHDAGVVEQRHRLGLVLEPPQLVVAGQDPGPDHLQGHRPVEADLPAPGRRRPCRRGRARGESHSRQNTARGRRSCVGLRRHRRHPRPLSHHGWPPSSARPWWPDWKKPSLRPNVGRGSQPGRAQSVRCPRPADSRRTTHPTDSRLAPGSRPAPSSLVLRPSARRPRTGGRVTGPATSWARRRSRPRCPAELLPTLVPRGPVGRGQSVDRRHSPSDSHSSSKGSQTGAMGRFVMERFFTPGSPELAKRRVRLLCDNANAAQLPASTPLGSASPKHGRGLLLSPCAD